MVATPIEYRAAAESSFIQVALAGEWNDWVPVPMQQLDSGTWVLTVDLAPGPHEFKFVADGAWVTSPMYSTGSDGHSGENNVFLVQDVESVRKEGPDHADRLEEIATDAIASDPADFPEAKGMCMVV